MVPGRSSSSVGALADPAAQPLQRDLDVARAKLDAVVEILELAPVPDFHRAAMAAFGLADAHAFRIVAIGAERRGACRADPFGAALVAALLLFEPLAQRLHQLVEAAKCRDQFLLLVGQVLFGKPPQPFFGEVGDVDRAFARQRFDTPEDMGKHLVEAVDVTLVLHQRGAREIVKSLDVELHQPGIHPLQQRQILAQRNRNARGLELEEEGDEHSPEQGSTIRKCQQFRRCAMTSDESNSGKRGKRQPTVVPDTDGLPPGTSFDEIATHLRASLAGRVHTPAEILQREGRDERIAELERRMGATKDRTR